MWFFVSEEELEALRDKLEMHELDHELDESAHFVYTGAIGLVQKFEKEFNEHRRSSDRIIEKLELRIKTLERLVLDKKEK